MTRSVFNERPICAPPWFRLSGRVADIVAGGRKAENTCETAGIIEQFGSRTICQTVDVNSRSSIDGLRDATPGEFGHVDDLVNVAGLTQRAPTVAFSEGDWDSMHRFGRPEELVGAVILPASDAASFVTGQCIAVDGGYLASGVSF